MEDRTRTIFLRTCHLVAASLEQYGYNYAKSSPRCTKRTGDLQLTISFGSDKNNLKGSKINLFVNANVFSRKIEKWAIRKSIPWATDFVAGGQIGNLVRNKQWIQWNLADSERSASSTLNLIKTIHKVALPYLDRFENPDKLATILINQDFPGMEIHHVLNFLMYFCNAGVAAEAGANFLQRHPAFIPEYRNEIEFFKDEESIFSSRFRTPALILAFASQRLLLGKLI